MLSCSRIFSCLCFAYSNTWEFKQACKASHEEIP
uniref:Uncharacterized protein n=1 Tax=Arundo donax TaxID=35708 RepID=A0A0A9F9B2_ARUDO